MRGNQSGSRDDAQPQRTIPACAGEPHCCQTNTKATEDYPRVCGGTTDDEYDALADEGLSPRVRGNLLGQVIAIARLWTIPACAGEPAPSSATGAIDKDYPRVCGGTIFKPMLENNSHGLSPRVRGNHIESP